MDVDLVLERVSLGRRKHTAGGREDTATPSSYSLHSLNPFLNCLLMFWRLAQDRKEEELEACGSFLYMERSEECHY